MQLRYLAGAAVLVCSSFAQTAGTPSEPVRYTGNAVVERDHDGGLRLAVGAKNYQVFRANRAHPTSGEPGWTYNHAPMLTHWKNRFYLEYLSDPLHESVAPGQSFLVTSSDGEHWSQPKMVFPVYQLPGGGRALKAFSFFHRPDGTVVGLWKSSWTSLSSDEGKTWSAPVQSPTLVMAEAKVWGQQTSDGHYALVYNPRHDNRHRWPLAVITGTDGIHFDDMATIHGEVPMPRYSGKEKSFGPQYVRGIESYPKPPVNDLWLAYSMNKEDIWVSRVPVPIRSRVESPVFDDFDHGSTADLDWNLYSPQWAPVGIADFPGAGNRSLELQDRDPADYARAIRVFPESKSVTASFKLLAKQRDTGRLEIELLDHAGYRPPVRLFLDEHGALTAWTLDKGEPVHVCDYQPNHWYNISIRADGKTFDLTVDGKTMLKKVEVLDPVASIERISFRTGPYRSEPSLRHPMWPIADLPGTDVPSKPAYFYIDDFRVTQ